MLLLLKITILLDLKQKCISKLCAASFWCEVKVIVRESTYSFIYLCSSLY